MGFSGVVSLSSMLGCSRFALSTFFVGCLVVPGFYLLVFPLLVSSSGFTSVQNSHLILYVISGRAKTKWIMTAGE